MPHQPVTAAERDHLRDLFLRASRGTWRARVVPQSREIRLLAAGADTVDGAGLLVATFNAAADAELAAAARNLVPRLFRDLDEARRQALEARLLGAIPVLGEVS